MILAVSRTDALAAKRATSTNAIGFGSRSHPVGQGVVRSLAPAAKSPHAARVAAFTTVNRSSSRCACAVVNMKTAQALGINSPSEIMLQVTEVIQ